MFQSILSLETGGQLYAISIRNLFLSLRQNTLPRLDCLNIFMIWTVFCANYDADLYVALHRFISLMALLKRPVAATVGLITTHEKEFAMRL
ncbi:MAG: hypothetical protein C5B58_06355 [Acidobacteria bacterium]|nr:MAG: hypothetical protein C5B58_06355 [Acidobacteriota bacterium]